MTTNMKNFFYPETVCLVGASTKKGSIGYELLNTIKTYKFTGKILPVNPKADKVLGFKCYKSINNIRTNIDLGIVAVPKAFAEESIKLLLEKGVKTIVLITAGFKETGKEGAEAERRILEMIKLHKAKMIGPNCMGVISTLQDVKLNATFVAEKPELGKIGFLSQSGALGAAVLNSLRETDIKFAHFISVGNKADVSENDILQFWQTDKNIKALTFYLESFVDGFEFVKPFMLGKISKPAIVLKAGRTKGGMKAASSHTGALGSKDKVVDALLKQFGIIRAENLEELFNTAKGFDNFPIPKGNRIAVVTNAGGPAILTVDALERNGLILSELQEKTKKELRQIVHPEGSINNPVDLLPGGDAKTYRKVNELLIKDKNVDAIVSIFVEPVMVEPMGVIEGINEISSVKPIFQVVMPLPEFWENYRKESKRKLPLFKHPEEPAKVLSNMIFFKQINGNIKKDKKEYKETIEYQPVKQNYDKGFLRQDEVNKLVEKYNLPIVKNLILSSNKLNQIGTSNFPLVIKGINKAVVHKSELDAVKLNIRDKKELQIASSEIIESFKKNNFEVEEFLIQPFIKTKYEVLLGGFRDPSFGPIIMFGSGGKYVEALSDISMRSAHISNRDIEEMIDETKIGKILRGVRGEKSIDITSLVKIIKSVAKMFIENVNIVEFDFNPLIISDANDIKAVDIRIKMD